ncbi:hypothetical protein PHISP_07523 [Aspergillus sp. HF37]|nr:hypothetical protein PHISP_07523 [Aspergillus sp. HF37]
MNKVDEIAFDQFAENTPPPNSEVFKTSSDQRVVSRPNNALEELHIDEPAHRDNKQPQVAATMRRSSGKIIPPPTQAAKEPTHSDNSLPQPEVTRRRSSGSMIQPPSEPAEEPTHPDNKLPPLGVTRRRSSGGMIQPHIKPADDPNRRRWRKIEATEKRRTISPRSKDPEAAREMICKGLERISKDTMDVVAYRKLQGLIEHHDDMFGDEELFDRLLMTLLEAMERPASEKVGFLGRPLDLSTQTLLTIRFMFWNCKKYFSAYYPKAMAALVSARRNYGGNSHIVSGLEDTVEDIAGVCKAGDALDAVLDVIVAEDRDEQGYHVVNLGIFAATAILSRVHTRLPNRLVGRIGKFCGEVLAGSRLDARRSVTLLCINLHSLVTPPEANFWQALGTLREDSRNMLSYYIGRQ